MPTPEVFCTRGPRQSLLAPRAHTRRLIGVGLLTLAGAALADDTPPSPAHTEAATRQWAPLDGPRLPARRPAAAELAAGTGTSAAPAFQAPWFTGSDAHKYLGLGTLVLVGLTAATAPHENECEHNCTAGTAQRQTSGTTHTRLARAAATLAGATVATGLLVHWDDFHLRDGFSDPDNQHVLLGLAGSLLMLYAVNKSMHSKLPTQHAAFAEVGGAAMAIAVKLTW
jgi:hypothetical protein